MRWRSSGNGIMQQLLQSGLRLHLCRRGKEEGTPSQVRSECYLRGNDVDKCHADALFITPNSYVDALESRMEKMEMLLSQIAPGVDFTDRIGPSVTLEGSKASKGQSPPNGTILSNGLSPPFNRSNISADAERDDGSGSDTDQEGITLLVNTFSRTDLQSQRHYMISNSASAQAFRDAVRQESGPYAVASIDPLRYFGASTTFDAIPLLGEATPLDARDRSPEEEPAKAVESNVSCFLDAVKFEQAWTISPREVPASVRLIWPDPELEKLLIDTYFRVVHPFLPVVNENAFRKDFENRPELRNDADWICLLLAMFCLGCRHLTDESRLEPFSIRAVGILQRGSRWYRQAVELGLLTTTDRTTLASIQSKLLFVPFISSAFGISTVSWNLLGTCIRGLQALGVHRKLSMKRLGPPLLVRETLWRIFWVAYQLDREIAGCLGRPLMIQDEDFDVDIPLDLSDKEIFEATMEGRPHKEITEPSIFSAFITSLPLSQIAGRALRTIYAIGKAKAMRGFVGWQWDQFIVSELDSALNEWLDTIPKHLHFDANEPDEATFIASADLLSHYYMAQILCHRPFLHIKANSPLNSPSVAICTNAARSAGHIFDAIRQRNLVHKCGSRLFMRAFSVASVLLIMVWNSRGLVSALSEVRKMTRFVKEGAPAEPFNIVLGNILEELLQRRDEQFENTDQQQRHRKRQHSADASDNIPPVATNRDAGAAPRRADSSSASSSDGSSHALAQFPLSTHDILNAFSYSPPPLEDLTSNLNPSQSVQFNNPFGNVPIDNLSAASVETERASQQPAHIPVTPGSFPSLEFESRRRLSAFAVDPNKPPTGALAAFLGGTPSARTPNAENFHSLFPNFSSFMVPTPQGADSESYQFEPVIPAGGEQSLTPAMFPGATPGGDGPLEPNSFQSFMSQSQVWGDLNRAHVEFL